MKVIMQRRVGNRP